MDRHQKDPPSIDSETFLNAYSRAMLYAERKMLKYTNSALGARLSAEDATHEAVIKVLNGKRPWSPEVVPDLFVHLAGCINSEISNAYSSKGYQTTDLSDPEDVFKYAACLSNSVESEVDFESTVAFVINFIVDKREDVKEIAELMLKEGVTEPRLIADQLGLPVPKVNAMKVTIRRILKNAALTLHYIASNRKDLVDISVAIYKESISCNEALAERLQIPATEVKKQRRELDRVVKEIHRGLI